MHSQKPDHCTSLGADIDTDASDYYFPILRNYDMWLKDVNIDNLSLYTSNTLDYRIKGCYPYFGNNSIVPSDEYNETEEL